MRLSLLVRFETRLHPLAAWRGEGMSTLCSVRVQSAFSTLETPPAPLQLLDSPHDDDDYHDDDDDEVRGLGWNELEIDAEEAVLPSLGACAWLRCGKSVLVHPPFLCSSSLLLQDNAPVFMGAFNLLPIVAADATHGVEAATPTPAAGLLLLLLFGLLLLQRWQKPTAAENKRGAKRTLEDWTLLGTVPQLQPDGQYVNTVCSPIPSSLGAMSVPQASPLPRPQFDEDTGANSSSSSSGDEDDSPESGDEDDSPESGSEDDSNPQCDDDDDGAISASTTTTTTTAATDSFCAIKSNNILHEDDDD